MSRLQSPTLDITTGGSKGLNAASVIMNATDEPVLSQIVESNSDTKPSWTAYEHGRFLHALGLFGPNFHKIQEYIGTKTIDQIKQYIVHCNRVESTLTQPPRVSTSSLTSLPQSSVLKLNRNIEPSLVWNLCTAPPQAESLLNYTIDGTRRPQSILSLEEAPPEAPPSPEKSVASTVEGTTMSATEGGPSHEGQTDGSQPTSTTLMTNQTHAHESDPADDGLTIEKIVKAVKQNHEVDQLNSLRLLREENISDQRILQSYTQQFASQVERLKSRIGPIARLGLPTTTSSSTSSSPSTSRAFGLSSIKAKQQAFHQLSKQREQHQDSLYPLEPPRKLEPGVLARPDDVTDGVPPSHFQLLVHGNAFAIPKKSHAHPIPLGIWPSLLPILPSEKLLDRLTKEQEKNHNTKSSAPRSASPSGTTPSPDSLSTEPTLPVVEPPSLIKGCRPGYMLASSTELKHHYMQQLDLLRETAKVNSFYYSNLLEQGLPLALIDATQFQQTVIETFRAQAEQQQQQQQQQEQQQQQAMIQSADATTMGDMGQVQVNTTLPIQQVSDGASQPTTEPDGTTPIATATATTTTLPNPSQTTTTTTETASLPATQTMTLIDPTTPATQPSTFTLPFLLPDVPVPAESLTDGDFLALIDLYDPAADSEQALAMAIITLRHHHYLYLRRQLEHNQYTHLLVSLYQLELEQQQQVENHLQQVQLEEVAVRQAHQREFLQLYSQFMPEHAQVLLTQSSLPEAGQPSGNTPAPNQTNDGQQLPQAGVQPGNDTEAAQEPALQQQQPIVQGVDNAMGDTSAANSMQAPAPQDGEQIPGGNGTGAQGEPGPTTNTNNTQDSLGIPIDNTMVYPPDPEQQKQLAHERLLASPLIRFGDLPPIAQEQLLQLEFIHIQHLARLQDLRQQEFLNLQQELQFMRINFENQQKEQLEQDRNLLLLLNVKRQENELQFFEKTFQLYTILIENDIILIRKKAEVFKAISPYVPSSLVYLEYDKDNDGGDDNNNDDNDGSDENKNKSASDAPSLTSRKQSSTVRQRLEEYATFLANMKLEYASIQNQQRSNSGKDAGVKEDPASIQQRKRELDRKFFDHIVARNSMSARVKRVLDEVKQKMSSPTTLVDTNTQQTVSSLVKSDNEPAPTTTAPPSQQPSNNNTSSGGAKRKLPKVHLLSLPQETTYPGPSPHPLDDLETPPVNPAESMNEILLKQGSMNHFDGPATLSLMMPSFLRIRKPLSSAPYTWGAHAGLPWLTQHENQPDFHGLNLPAQTLPYLDPSLRVDPTIPFNEHITGPPAPGVFRFVQWHHVDPDYRMALIANDSSAYETVASISELQARQNELQQQLQELEMQVIHHEQQQQQQQSLQDGQQSSSSAQQDETALQHLKEQIQATVQEFTDAQTKMENLVFVLHQHDLSRVILSRLLLDAILHVVSAFRISMDFTPPPELASVVEPGLMEKRCTVLESQIPVIQHFMISFFDPVGALTPADRVRLFNSLSRDSQVVVGLLLQNLAVNIAVFPRLALIAQVRSEENRRQLEQTGFHLSGGPPQNAYGMHIDQTRDEIAQKLQSNYEQQAQLQQFLQQQQQQQAVTHDELQQLENQRQLLVNDQVYLEQQLQQHMHQDQQQQQQYQQQQQQQQMEMMQPDVPSDHDVQAAHALLVQSGQLNIDLPVILSQPMHFYGEVQNSLFANYIQQQAAGQFDISTLQPEQLAALQTQYHQQNGHILTALDIIQRYALHHQQQHQFQQQQQQHLHQQQQQHDEQQLQYAQQQQQQHQEQQQQQQHPQQHPQPIDESTLMDPLLPLFRVENFHQNTPLELQHLAVTEPGLFQQQTDYLLQRYQVNLATINEILTTGQSTWQALAEHFQNPVLGIALELIFSAPPVPVQAYPQEYHQEQHQPPLQ